MLKKRADMALAYIPAVMVTFTATVYPSVPGTIAGQFDAERYRFKNFRYPEVSQDLNEFWNLLKKINPGVCMLPTVSPVPLTATASGEHVLVANPVKSDLTGSGGGFGRE